MTKGKITRIIFHGLVWVILVVLPVYLAKRYRIVNDFLLPYYTFLAVNALIFYTNYLFLVPRLFFRKKKYRFVFSVLGLVICFYFITSFANGQINNRTSKNDTGQSDRQRNERRIPRQPPRSPGIIVAIPHARLIGYASSSLFMVFLSLGLRLLERQDEVEKAKLNAELAILKNQISPHFFFNTLNNIYSLIGRNNEDSKNAVIKLSKLMRYVLNESGEDNKLLNEEIAFMNNYIDLMKLRIGSRTRLNVNFPTGYSDIKVPHLIFITLIENAFKYGISVQDESFVNISLECEENIIRFKCENGLPESNRVSDQTSSGIGLDNLQKRLNLIYPDSHELEINKTGDKYEVTLNISL